MNQKPNTTAPTEEQLCDLAREAVENEYFREGEITYYSEEWDDPLDDTTAHSVASSLPPDSEYYQSSTVTSCEVTSLEVKERNDKKGNYTVEVKVDVVIDFYDTEDELISEGKEGEATEPEERIVDCYICRSKDGSLYVDNMEE